MDLSQPFSVAFWFRHSGLVAKGLLHKMDGPASRRGLAMTLSAPVSIPDTLRREYDLSVRLSSSPDSAILARTKAPLRDARGEDATYHIVVSYDGSGRAAGLTLHVNGEPAESTVLSDSLSGSPAVATPFEIGAGRFGGRYTGTRRRPPDLLAGSGDGGDRRSLPPRADPVHSERPLHRLRQGALRGPAEACRRHLRPEAGYGCVAVPIPDEPAQELLPEPCRPGYRPPPLQAAAGTEGGADRPAAAGAERDGHAGAPRASGDLHAWKRRLPEPHGQGVAGNPRLASGAPRGQPRAIASVSPSGS